MSFKNNEIKSIEYTCNGKTLTFSKPLVMAIVNLSPDSFYDGGRYNDVTNVLNDVYEKIKSGASIIDLGACSTRPGAADISEEEERGRLIPVLKEVRKKFSDIFISIDTYRASIAKQCAAEGADIINDISGGNFDNNMFATVANLQLPYVLMHIKGAPSNMQKDPQYDDVVKEVTNDLRSKIRTLQQHSFNKIIIDPGFGFGKTAEHNFKLLKALSDIGSGFPILAGVSRKSMINRVIKTNPVTSLNGTTVVNTIALLNGASILRVHDALEAKQAIELVEYYKNV